MLILPFIRLGSCLFHTEPLLLSLPALVQAARTNPVSLTRNLWIWQWHAVVVWAALSAVAVPLLALALTPLLRRLLLLVERREYPIAP